MPYTFNGYRNTTLVLNNGTQNPATIGTSGTINVNSTLSSTAGILGTAGIAWTVTNNGTVQSIGSFGTGIDLRSGGTITNAPAPSFGTAGPGPLVGGIIRGTGEGIDISGAAGSLSNSGTIQQIGTAGSNGVYLRAGGTISNTGTISAQATISNGVQLGAVGRIVNGVSGSNAGLISG